MCPGVKAANPPPPSCCESLFLCLPPSSICMLNELSALLSQMSLSIELVKWILKSRFLIFGACLSGIESVQYRLEGKITLYYINHRELM